MDFTSKFNLESHKFDLANFAQVTWASITPATTLLLHGISNVRLLLSLQAKTNSTRHSHEPHKHQSEPRITHPTRQKPRISGPSLHPRRTQLHRATRHRRRDQRLRRRALASRLFTLGRCKCTDQPPANHLKYRERTHTAIRTSNASTSTKA